MYPKELKHSKGFTLIELLVVIAIISLLSSIVLVTLRAATAKARDAKRRSEVRQMKVPFEIYYQDHDRYPRETYCDSSFGACGHACPCENDGNWDSSSSFYQDFVNEKYVEELPTDPINEDPYYYSYEPSSDGEQGYYFRARLETGGWWGVCGGTLEGNWSWCH